MEPFAQVFFAIVKGDEEVITLDQLERYVKENHLDHSMVTRWSELFDPQKTGKITFKTFCEVLGLEPEAARQMGKQSAEQLQALKQQKAAEKPPDSGKSLNPDIQIIVADIPEPEQVQIGDKAVELSQPKDSFDETSLTQKLKEWLDKTYGRSWQVIVVDGSHWMSYAYTPGKSFQFRLYNHSYLIWQSPYLEEVRQSEQKAA